MLVGCWLLVIVCCIVVRCVIDCWLIVGWLLVVGCCVCVVVVVMVVVVWCG